jgi:hypothetical protein
MTALAELERKFAELGVDNPGGWASSQLDEGIPQLTRATLLVEFARLVQESVRDVLGPDSKPSERIERVLAATRSAGVPEQDLALLLQFAASLVVMNICTLLDGASQPVVNPGAIAVSIAHGIDDGSDDDIVFEADDLALHESWGEVVTALIGKEAYWS